MCFLASENVFQVLLPMTSATFGFAKHKLNWSASHLGFL
jgi:hypothetical protein